MTLSFALPPGIRGPLRLTMLSGDKAITDSLGVPFSGATFTVSLTPVPKHGKT